MITRLPPGLTRPDPVRPQPILPPPGPPWFGSLMGTAILATLHQLHADQAPWARTSALVFLMLAWMLLIGLSLGFCFRVARDSTALTSTIVNPTAFTAWGMVSMGILATGSATRTVVPAWAPHLLGLAIDIDAVLWTVGTLLGIATTLWFAALLMARDIGRPAPTWGLPLVPPMVSATTGAALVPALPTPGQRLLLLIATVACFFLALTMGLVVFALAYRQHWRIEPVPLPLSASTWIPLGIVGQSTAAAQAIAEQTRALLVPEAVGALMLSARAYGTGMLALGAPLAAYAAVVTARGFARRMPFSPGWWALTFPIGTCSLGAHLLGWSIVGLVLCGLLTFTWTVCVVGTLRALAAALPAESTR